LFSERKDRFDDSPASRNLLGQSVHFMALANAEFVHIPARELLLEQPQIVLLTSENLKRSAYSIVIENIRLGSRTVLSETARRPSAVTATALTVRLWSFRTISESGEFRSQ
jgi:hypothetical protein